MYLGTYGRPCASFLFVIIIIFNIFDDIIRLRILLFNGVGTCFMVYGQG